MAIMFIHSLITFIFTPLTVVLIYDWDGKKPLKYTQQFVCRKSLEINLHYFYSYKYVDSDSGYIDKHKFKKIFFICTAFALEAIFLTNVHRYSLTKCINQFIISFFSLSLHIWQIIYFSNQNLTEIR